VKWRIVAMEKLWGYVYSAIVSSSQIVSKKWTYPSLTYIIPYNDGYFQQNDELKHKTFLK
jgi:hypothetical protein